MRANKQYTVRVQEPRVVYDKDGIVIKHNGDYSLYVYGMYIGSFGSAFDAEMAGHRVIAEQRRAA